MAQRRKVYEACSTDSVFDQCKHHRRHISLPIPTSSSPLATKPPQQCFRGSMKDKLEPGEHFLSALFHLVNLYSAQTFWWQQGVLP